MKKLLKVSITKKRQLKNKKQQLIERINRCKTLSEINGISKTLEYYPVLSKDYDWDYAFFFELIRFKLRRMRDYFWTHNIVENEKEYGNICNKLINILDAGYLSNIVTDEDLNVFVNDRSVKRFIPEKTLDFMSRDALIPYWNPSVRQAKAKALFWKLLEHKIEELWD